MRLLLVLRSLPQVLLLLLFALVIPKCGFSQPLAPGLPELAPEARDRWTLAAQDTSHLRWQYRSFSSQAQVGATPQPESDLREVLRNHLQRASTTSDGSWTELVVSARAFNSAIYDPVRKRMIVFGGFTPAPHNDVWALSLSGTSAWTALTPNGALPAARHGHSAIYDPVRDRMIVFGGMRGGTLENDVWALSLAGTPAWESLSPANTPPSGREYHSAIYDPVRDRMIVFGGYDGVSSLRNDVWALSLSGTPAWTQLSPSGTAPVARSNHSAIYDPVADRMVVFGGSDFNALHNDVWALSLAGAPTWTALAPAGVVPTRRYLHTAIFDPARDRMIVCAGWDNSGARPNDVWALSLAGTPTWNNLTPAENPLSARYLHSAIYDPASDRMIVFGGEAPNDSYLNDTWALSLATTPAWSELNLGRTPPSQRDGMSVVWDPVRNRVLVFGGVENSYTYHNDVWALSLTDSPTWTMLTPSGNPPTARAHHSAIYDPVRDRMLVFGGCPGGNWYRNDVWALSLTDTVAWTALAPAGSLPPDRQNHSAIYDPLGDRMVIFGGINAYNMLGDTWALSLGSAPLVWSALSTTGTPPCARDDHSAVYDPARMRMLVFGGRDASAGRLNDVSALSLSDPLLPWTQLMPAGTPPTPRMLHSAVCDPARDRMVVFGGLDATGFRADLWALSLTGQPAWEALLPGGTGPSARDGQGAVYAQSQDRMVVYGGSGGYSRCLTDAWAFAGAALDKPPVCGGAEASEAELWPPNHRMVPINIIGVTDPDGDPVRISIDSVTQDEPVGDSESAHCPDAQVVDGQLWLRAECLGQGNGRVYGVFFTADDRRGGICHGRVSVCAPHDMRPGHLCVDDGQNFDAMKACKSAAGSVSGRPADPPEAVTRLGLELVSTQARQCVFEYTLPREAQMRLAVYDVAGRLLTMLENGVQSAGIHRISWNTSAVRPGVYFCRLRGSCGSVARSVVVLGR